MGDRLDDFVKGLQDQIFEETREAYGELGFQRWRHPLYRGAMEDADAHGRLTGTCGDTMQISLKFKDGQVAKASFLTDGCGASTVCGSLTAEMALEKTPEELTDIDGHLILKILGTFPEEDQHCAFLATATLQAALEQYMKRQIHRT